MIPNNPVSDKPAIDCRRIGGDGHGQAIILSRSTIDEALEAIMEKWERGSFKGMQDDMSFYSANTAELRAAYEALFGRPYKKE